MLCTLENAILGTSSKLSFDWLWPMSASRVAPAASSAMADSARNLDFVPSCRISCLVPVSFRSRSVAPRLRVKREAASLEGGCVVMLLLLTSLIGRGDRNRCRRGCCRREPESLIGALFFLETVLIVRRLASLR